MIKIEISDAHSTVVHSGDPLEVAAEIGGAIGAIYNGYKCSDEVFAEMFRKALNYLMEKGSPVWAPGDGGVTTIVMKKKKGGA